VHDLNCDRCLVFALSLHLAIAHVYVLPADMDLCHIDDHQFFVLHHLIGVVRRCECRAPDHGRRGAGHAVHDHDQNFLLDDARHHHGEDEPDDPNYHDADDLVDHDQNFLLDEPDDPNYHDGGDLDDRGQSCEPDDQIDH